MIELHPTSGLPTKVTDSINPDPALFTSTMSSAHAARQQLDRLLAFDAVFSLIFGALSILAPHGFLAALTGGFYNHSVHETLR